MYKVVDARNQQVIAENLDYYAARFETEKNTDHYTLMEQDADIADRLERRAKMIAKWDAEEAEEAKRDCEIRDEE